MVLLVLAQASKDSELQDSGVSGKAIFLAFVEDQLLNSSCLEPKEIQKRPCLVVALVGLPELQSTQAAICILLIA